jgi:flavodoxin
MGKAIVVYSTRTGETKTSADLIAEGIRIQAPMQMSSMCQR